MDEHTERTAIEALLETIPPASYYEEKAIAAEKAVFNQAVDKAREQLKAVDKAMSEASGKGLRTLTYNEPLNELAVKVLIARTYQVQCNSYAGDHHYVWSTLITFGVVPPPAAKE